ncbi:MAG TPA: 50S ribosomal protein L3 [Candidatus Saccharimonadia bacterium]|jgi:large subunit ribosomal protein L3|nr:50S ribosomal protein L3 [Candidatus Saccharimonadia bacterium]
MKALLGTKLGMTQLFDQGGNVARVTLIQAGPCVVTQVKTVESDGYNAIQLGFGEAKHQPKPQAGHLKAAGSNSRYMREVRIKDIQAGHPDAKAQQEAANAALALEVGSKIDVTAFEAGDVIQVTGTSKGKGFAGTIKRHNFTTGPKTHGSHNYRAPGSIGSGYPEHVFKGMHMAGRMGHDQVTVKGLKVVVVDEKLGVLAVSGAVPGPKRGLVMVRGNE